MTTWHNSSGSTWDISSTNNTSSTINVYQNLSFKQPRRTACNESGKHDNQEKAFYHGLKSAYRMSRQSSGEYGVSSGPVPYESAARIAANVAMAFFETTDVEYDRDKSMEYLEENIFSETTIKSRLMALLGYGDDPKLVTDEDLSAGIDKAWNQVDDKWNHDDSARTALAIAEAYLGETLYDPDR